MRRVPKTPAVERARAGAALAAGAVALSACGRGAPPAPPAAPSPGTGAPEAGFLRPPELVNAVRATDGRVLLRGRAAPGERVRLASPAGEALEALSARDGGWTLSLPAANAPRLYAVSGQLGERTLRAEGALAVTPAGALPPALLLRSGAPAWIAGAPPSQGAVLASVDFDGGGGFAASGTAAPGGMVALALDGAAAGQDHADVGGRYGVLAVAAPAQPGPHTLSVQAAAGGQSRRVDLTAAAPLAQPFRATRVEGGWRIDWASPGGATQSVVVFDASPPAAAPAETIGAGR